MRCASYSTAQSYDLSKRGLLHLSKWDLKDFKDVLCFSSEGKFIFIFSYGCVTFWNLSIEEEEDFINRLDMMTDAATVQNFDTFEYTIGKSQKILQDVITLDSSKSIDLQMLAVSYGLSQSQALAYFEERINKQVAQTKFIAQDMATHGRIPLSRKEISKKMGEVILERNLVNLHTDILDTPGFIWDHSEYNNLYEMTLLDLDFHSRTEVLNTRMSILKDLFEIMGDAVHSRHATALEWIIVILISMEVVLTLLIHVFKVI